MAFNDSAHECRLPAKTLHSRRSSESLGILTGLTVQGAGVMPKLVIDQFMFPYQHHFRTGVQMLVDYVLRSMGANASARVFVVGARAPDANARHDVCIEPEEGEWSREPFEGLLPKIEATVRDHPMQNMFYGDEASMQDKPENIRRSSVTEAVRAILASSDEVNALRSFADSLSELAPTTSCRSYSCRKPCFSGFPR